MKAIKGSNHFHLTLLIASSLLFAASLVFYQIQNTQAKVQNEKEDAKLSREEKHLNRNSCDNVDKLVINVKQRVVNDADSGVAGNFWGLDRFERQIKVWKRTNGTFCAIVDYEGTFQAFAGQRSPGNTGVLTGKEHGEFKGGYVGDITGFMKQNPDLTTKGSIGEVDYQCDVNGNCPGAFNWMDKYFMTQNTSFSFTYVSWGWTYKNGNHVWINASTGNSGDII